MYSGDSAVPTMRSVRRAVDQRNQLVARVQARALAQNLRTPAHRGAVAAALPRAGRGQARGRCAP
jgi:hypothetical protein